jgi:hypothetical protein
MDPTQIALLYLPLVLGALGLAVAMLSDRRRAHRR